MDPKDYESRAHAFDDCLAQNRIDALIYNQWLCGTALWELLIAKLRNVPIVVCAHGVFSFPLIELSDATAFAKRLVELPITLPLAEAIVCASTADIAFWRARNPNVFLARYKSPSMAGLFNMDSDATTQSGSTHGARPQSTSAQPPSKPRIVWVGRLAPEKRPLDAIRIFAKVKHAVPEAILDIVGPSEGGLSDAVKQEAAKLRISGSVNLHGYQNDVARFYQNASIYLHTSATESYCLSLGEAKSWGLPCVMYELPFLELAKSGEEGGIIAIAHRDIDAAAKACIRLLESPNLLHSLGQAARRDIAPILRFSETEFWKGVLDSLRHEKELPSRREDALADDAFRVAYINAIDDLREKLDSVRQEALATRNELELIRSSTTFKVGKAVLAIPTRIKDAILSRHR